MRRYIGGENSRLNWCQQIKRGIFSKPRNINSQYHIGRAGRAFGLEPLGQAFRCINGFGFDASGLGKGIQKRLDQHLLSV